MTPFSIKPFPDPLILVYYLRFRNSWIQFLSFIFRNLSFFIYQNSSSSSIPLPVLDLIKSLEFKYCHPNEERGLFDNGLRNWGYQLFTIDPPAVNTGHVGRPGQALMDLSESIFKLTIKRIATIIDKSGVSPACSCVTRVLEFNTQRMNVIDVIKIQIENIVKQPRRSAIINSNRPETG